MYQATAVSLFKDRLMSATSAAKPGNEARRDDHQSVGFWGLL